jgi:hypothetical protein
VPDLIELQAESPKVLAQQGEGLRAELALNIQTGRITSRFPKSLRKRIAPPRIVLEKKALRLGEGVLINLREGVVIFRQAMKGADEIEWRRGARDTPDEMFSGRRWRAESGGRESQRR